MLLYYRYESELNMGFPKRPSEVKRLISRLDPSLAIYDRDTHKKYHETLDIKVLKLEDQKFVDPPFIFHCLPLRSSMSNLYSAGNMTANDMWNIFKTHVAKVENIPAEWNMKKDGDYLDDSVREYFTNDVIEDIATMINQWANADGDLIPFRVVPSILAEQDIYRRKLHATQRDQPVV